MADPSLASNNPFRRHTTAPSTSQTSSAASASALVTSAPLLSQPTLPLSLDTEASADSVTTSWPAAEIDHGDGAHAQQHPTGDEFREQLRALPKSSEAPPSTTFLKPKPVKKVRVQSPPPSSPDSVDADFESRFPANGPSDSATAADTLKTANNADRFFSSPTYNDDDDDSSGSSSSDPEDSDKNTARALGSLGDFEPSSMSTKPKAGTFPIAASHTAPANPFQRTLGDLEAETRTGTEGHTTPQVPPHHAGSSVPIEKGSLDVDSFRRLLLTGQTGAGLGIGAAARLQHDGGSITDASSGSRQSLFDSAHPVQDGTPRSSHEISETDDDRSGLIQPSQSSSDRHTLRKKPPPPNSRHGKLIKSHLDTSTDESGATSEQQVITAAPQATGSPSDMNKPLPLPPARRSIDEGADSIFDQEAAGKVPEVDDVDVTDDAIYSSQPPTLPNAHHSTVTDADTADVTPSPPQLKKPTPPPPRHGHIRSDSRSSVQERQHLQTPPSSHGKTEQTHQSEQSPTASPRSSYESARSRSSSLKLGTNAPAPPPPRRVNHISRPSTSFVSPSSMQFSTMPSSASSPSAVSEQERSPPGLSAAVTAPVAAPPAAVHIHPSIPVSSDNSGVTASPTLHRSISSTSTSAMTPGLSSSGSASGVSKGLKPPPPPTRNPSVRNKERPGFGSHRPPSVSSVDGVSRRVTTLSHSHAQPPPPPPRARGSSRGSMDAPLGPPGSGTSMPTQRKTSTDSSRRMASGGSLANVDEGELPVGATAADPRGESGSAANILADLNALQREVDALRGQYGKPNSS